MRGGATGRSAPFRFVLGLLVSLPLGSGCGTVLPPLRGEIDVGRDAYGVFVGGERRSSDLYAFEPDGAVLQLTYTAVAELAPALSPDGFYVALLRAATLRDSLPGTAWLINLQTGDDRELTLPRSAGTPRRLGWARTSARSGGAEAALYVAADSGVYRFDAPVGRVKARAVAGAERAVADSSFAVLLGQPVFARVLPCANDAGSLCVASDTGAPDLLAREARDPMRWGTDSVAYVVQGMFEVRPLGPGRPRYVKLVNPPARPRAPTFFAGASG